MKKIFSILLTLTLCASTLWAEQVTVKLYQTSNTVKEHELITQKLGGKYRTSDIWNTDGFICVNQDENTDEASITFSTPDATVMKSWKFGLVEHVHTLTGNKPSYKVNSEAFIDISGNGERKEDAYNSQSLLITGKASVKNGLLTGFKNDWRYPRFNNFEFVVLIPEVVGPLNTPTKPLDPVTGSQLNAGTVQRTCTLTFQVKDPIGTTAATIKDYYTATIEATDASNGQWSLGDWSVTKNGELYNVNIPAIYVANKEKIGNFEAIVELKPNHTISNYEGNDYTISSTQRVTVAVNEKSNYTVEWGNGWTNGGEITLYKGKVYPRTGGGGYLADTQQILELGKELGVPVVTPSNSNVLSFDNEGNMILNEVGTVKLTYTQNGDDYYHDKILTLTVNVDKQTPKFTLQSDEYDEANNLHIFYVNHDYVPFVTSTNDSYLEYLVSVENNNAENDQFISFRGISATTYSIPQENISITIKQDGGNLWYSKEETFKIAIRENPIHVETLCERTPAELFLDKRFTKEYLRAVEASDGSITIGARAGGSDGGWIIFSFVGTPEKLQWTHKVIEGNATWTAEQSVDGVTFVKMDDDEPIFDENARFLKLSIVGTEVLGKITSLCITEKVGATITPNSIELIAHNGVVYDATFAANVFNLTGAKLVISGTNADKFELVREGDSNSNSMTLDYTDGLGIDRSVSLPIKAHYTGDPADALNKTCTLAIYDDDDNKLDEATIKIVELTTEDGEAPPVIVDGIADKTGLYTGTDHTGTVHPKNGTFPYKSKRVVDVSAAFVNGTPQFDKLYIFGLTTNDNAQIATSGDVQYSVINTTTPTVSSNAVTPCYIYEKNNGAYILTKTIDNVNVATKPSDFTINASGQKIYFTGYAPYVSCGSTWEENGVFHMIGDASALDLYLDNLQVYARPKAVNGNTVIEKKFELEISNALSLLSDPDLNANLSGDISATIFVQGGGSMFCFQSTHNGSSAFRPSIHVRGENLLESTQGAIVTIQSSLMDELADGKSATQHSSPIQIVLKEKKIAENTKTNLTIDDKWPSQGGTTRTNGILNLANASARPAPTIDLGNSHTVLKVDGGQLLLSNAYNNSGDYTVSYAISYRMKSMMSGMGRIFGVGDDQPLGTVKFTDGSISCKPLSEANFASAQGQALYHNRFSMKCPQNTTIDGGTFNCEVLACSTTKSKGSSPKDSKGNWVCMRDIDVEELETNGTAIMPSNWKDIAISLGAKSIIKNNDYVYGIESLTPSIVTEGDNTIMTVHLMLPNDDPCFQEIINTSWAMCLPKLQVTAMGETVEFGGAIDVLYGATADHEQGLNKVDMTHRFMYAEMDQFLQNSIASYQAPSGTEINIELVEDNSEYGGAPGDPRVVLNEAKYAIYDKIYMLMPVVANQWKIFTAPFDISNVYVIESYPEDKLIEDFGTETTDKKGNTVKKILGADKILQARYAQSHRMIDLLYQWLWSADMLKQDYDFWPATGTTPTGFLKIWMEMYAEKDADGKIISNLKKPKVEQLYHYTSADVTYPDGKQWWDANFYLYEVDGESWDVTYEGMDAKWKEVTTISKKRDTSGKKQNIVIMQKGHTYSISFPSTIVNSEKHDYVKNWDYWDYWTGKYILLEGYANEMVDSDENGEADSKGQVISGMYYDWNDEELTSSFLEEYYESGSAVIRGNATFSQVDATYGNTFVLNSGEYATDGKPIVGYEHNVFVSIDESTDLDAYLYPGQSVVLANDPESSSAMPARRLVAIDPITGNLTYRDNVTTSLPTIGGNNQMFVYNIAGGVGIVPVVEQQVSIYNAAGQLVTSEYLTDEVHISLPTGIYLIAGAQDQFKAVVK